MLVNLRAKIISHVKAFDVDGRKVHFLYVVSGSGKVQCHELVEAVLRNSPLRIKYFENSKVG